MNYKSSNQFFHSVIGTAIHTNMTKIESEKVTLNKPAKEVYDFLSDFNNFEKLMPELVATRATSSRATTTTAEGF